MPTKDLNHGWTPMNTDAKNALTRILQISANDTLEALSCAINHQLSTINRPLAA
jgi:hypothetical protein